MRTTYQVEQILCVRHSYVALLFVAGMLLMIGGEDEVRAAGF